MTELSVNLNAVAMLRNRRDVGWPSVTGIGHIALEAGAAGLTVHPRPDERHIRRTDVYDIRDLLRRDFPDREYNIEGYPTEDFLKLVEDVRPDQVTLVPDDPAQATSDHGWDIDAHAAFLRDVLARLKGQGMRTAIFVDADPAVAAKAKGVGTDRVELYTGPYGASFGTPEGDRNLADLAATARAVCAEGLGINAGHDLTLENLPAFKAAVPHVSEASIGHGLTSDALIYGYADAVKRYVAVLKG